MSNAGSSWNPDRHDGGRLLEKTDEFREFTWTGLKIHEKRKT